MEPVLKHRLALQCISAAMACNLTRVASFHMSPGPYYPFLDLGGGKPYVHNDIVHNMRDAPGDQNTRFTSRVHRWYAGLVAELIDQLKAVPEAGGSVYDNTIILWTNEHGNAAQHWVWNVPFVLAGGGGRWRKGRYLSFGAAPNLKGETAAHNRLLVSVAQQFGVQTQTFGDAEFAGPLPGL
jgi:hypothetical protein